MKAIMEFNLPEESDEHRDALDGAKWKQVVLDLDQHYRGVVKYGNDEAAAKHAEKVRDKIREICGDWNLNLDA